MKRLFILSVLLGTVLVNVVAQDDLYFTPKKSTEHNVQGALAGSAGGSSRHYKGERSVDEYNHRGLYSSYYQKVGTDSLGNDIIEFHTSAEDSLLASPEQPDVQYDSSTDYSCTRRMSRFDDYYWDPWYYSYSRGFWGYPPYWYGRWGWYDPWYDWYDPWYYSWYGYGWYGPWRYGWYGWGLPYYAYYDYHYPTGGGRVRNGYYAGTSNHGVARRAGTGRSSVTGRGGNFGGYRGNGKETSYTRVQQERSGSGRFGGRRGTSGSTYSGSRSSYNSSASSSYGSRGGSFGGYRSSGSSSSGSFSGSRSSGGSSFGGSRGGGGGSSSGGGGGGSRGGGGGSFGGRR